MSDKSWFVDPEKTGCYNFN